jgi:PTH1 family peptidyl-tRNA hydrolase
MEALAVTGTAVGRTLIVLDDFQLPLGTLRIRPAGSDGGHRGLGSVIASLGTDQVPRLRCGIGKDVLPPKEERREFVLEAFAGEEVDQAREMVRRAADAARAFALSGINHAMTVYNTP